MDYQPSVEHIDGEYTDMMIEEILNLIYKDYYDADHFDAVYTGIVRTYIQPDCPDLVASRAGKDRVSGGAIHYISMLGLDYMVIHAGNPSWPEFDYMPDAVIAVSIMYPNGEDASSYAPGKSINQASLGAIMQIAREVATKHLNQPALDMNPNFA